MSFSSPINTTSRAVFFRQPIYFFLYHPNQFAGRLLRCILIHEVGENRRQVGVLHGDGDAITTGQKLIGARTPVIDPFRERRGHWKT